MFFRDVFRFITKSCRWAFESVSRVIISHGKEALNRSDFL